MKTPGYVHLLLTLFVCVAAHRARAADAEIWLVGNDQDALQIAQQVLSNKGLGVTYARGNDVPPGVYVAMPSFNKSGKDMDSGYAVAGGATMLVVYYHCTRYVDLFVGRWTAGYYGYEQGNMLDRDIYRVNSNTMSTEIETWLGSDFRGTTEEICRKHVKSHA